MATVYVEKVTGLALTEEHGAIVALTREYRVAGLTPGLEALQTALDVAGMPQAGDICAEYPNLTVVGRAVKALDKDAAFADVRVEYKAIGKEGLLIFAGDAALRVQKTQRDRFGNQIYTEHTFPEDDPDFPGMTVQAPGEVDMENSIQTVRARGVFKVDNPQAFVDRWNRTVNSTVWNEGAPGVWKCAGVTFELHDAATTPASWMFTFEFQGDPDGWMPEVMFIDARTGLPPVGLVEGVGYKKVAIYKPRDFNVLFPVE